MEIQFDALEVLLKAPNKEYVNRLFLEAFMHRDEVHLSEMVLQSISEQLDIELNASEQVSYIIHRQSEFLSN